MEAVQAAKTSIKAEPEGAYTANEMRQEWQPWWVNRKDGAEKAARTWEAWADSTGAPVLEERVLVLPSAEDFLQALAALRGAEGMDGWRSSELRELAAMTPWLFEEPPTSHDVRGIAVVRPLSLNSFVTQGRKAAMRGLASSMISHLGVGTHAVCMAALLGARQTCGCDASRRCSCPQR